MIRARRFELPGEIELHAHRGTDGRVEFRYIERDLDAKTLERTAQMLKPVVAAGCVIETSGTTVTLSGTLDRGDFGDAMTGEFLSWSHLADVTLGEFLAAVVRMTMEAKAPPPKVSQVELLDAQISRGALCRLIDEFAATVPAPQLEDDVVRALETLLVRAHSYRNPDDPLSDSPALCVECHRPALEQLRYRDLLGPLCLRCLHQHVENDKPIPPEPPRMPASSQSIVCSSCRRQIGRAHV
jgi:hypothetical protein